MHCYFLEERKVFKKKEDSLYFVSWWFQEIWKSPAKYSKFQAYILYFDYLKAFWNMEDVSYLIIEQEGFCFQRIHRLYLGYYNFYYEYDT